MQGAEITPLEQAAMLTKDYHKAAPRKPRGIGKRKCDHCGRWHKPLSESVRFCGSCSARKLAHAWRGLWR